MSVSRRNVLAFGASLGVLGFLAKMPSARASSDRPHFLVAIQIQNGVDASYLFDGRGALLTEKNLKANYLLRNDLPSAPTRPEEFTAARTAARTIHCERTGCSAIRSPLVDALWAAHGDRLSIVNGVHMLRNSVGHDENSVYFWANAERGGGPVFPPLVGRALASGCPLDSILLRSAGGTFPQASNAATSADLASDEVVGLSQTLADGPRIAEGSAAWRQILGRADANAQGDGSFSRGSSDLGQALRRARATGTAFAASTTGEAALDPGVKPTLSSMVRQSLAFFSGGLTRVASIVVTDIVDRHAAPQAQADTVPTYTRIANEIARAIDLLKTTMFVDARGVATPFIDLTTFVITSEFNRTMRSKALPAGASVGATGTDHNPLANSVIVGGRGIVGGLVVGESDLRECDDDGKLLGVSGAHREKDASLDAVMGRPFDFAAQRLRTDLPERYDERDYITMPSLTNTILDVFDVPETSRFKLGSAVAPMLGVLREGRS
jgi:hypothetical protein